MDGEIIGVNMMKLAAADGLGFSVPIDSVSKIIEHFKRSGYVLGFHLYYYECHSKMMFYSSEKKLIYLEKSFIFSHFKN